MAKLLGQGVREDRALAYLMIACFVIFIGQLPRLARMSHIDGTPFERLAGYEFAAWLMVWPLAMYIIAAIIRILAKPLGGKGSFYSARLALFWALLASVPALLLHGLVAGLIGPGVELTVVGVLWVLVFFWIWIGGIIVSEFPSGQSVHE